MIDFTTSEDERLLTEAAERFGNDQLRPQERDHEAARVYPAPLRAAYADLGFAGLGVPEDVDGAGLDVSLRIATWTTLAEADSTAPLALSTHGPGALSLWTMDRGRELLERSGARGRVVWAGGVDVVADVATGTVDWVPCQEDLDWLVLVDTNGAYALTDPQLELLEARPCGLRAAGGVRLTLDGVSCQRVGDGAFAKQLLAECRVFAGALMLGAARDANVAAIQYAKERVAFGKPIAHHQGLAFQLVDAATDLAGARLLLDLAAREEHVALIANAYAHAAEVALRVAERSVQALGGHGYLYDHRVEKRMRDIRALASLYGGPIQAELDVAADLFDLPNPIEVGQLDDGFSNVLRMIRYVGKDLLRPAGLEAERTGKPLPPDHWLFPAFNQTGLTFGLPKKGTRGPETDDGPSRVARSAILAAEELAYWDQGACMALPGAGLGGPPLGLLGTPEQKERFLKAPFANPDEPAWGAYATTESGAGSDVARMQTRAVRDGDHYVLNGDKMFITNGARAAWVIVFATIDPEAGRAGQRAFVVEKGTPGFGVLHVEKKMGLTASETAALYLQDCRVPVENLLGGPDTAESKKGFRTAMKTMDMTRPMVAAMSVGIGRCAWERARDVARDAFGANPTSPRALLLLDRLAGVRRRLDAARLLCWKAVWKMDHKEPNTVEASMAKCAAPRAAMEATSVAMDVCALAGVRNDPLVEKCFRDVKVFDIFEGTGEIQRVVLARRLLDYPSSRSTA